VSDRRGKPRAWETRQITVPLRKPQDATDIFLSGDYRGGYAWLFPRGDVANLGLGVIPSDRHRLKSLLLQLHARLVDEDRVGSEVLALTGGAIPVGDAASDGEIHSRALLPATRQAHQPGHWSGHRRAVLWAMQAGGGRRASRRSGATAPTRNVEIGPLARAVLRRRIRARHE
jgi:hypothetical protein